MFLKRPPLNQGMSWSPYSPPRCCMAANSFSMRRAALSASLPGMREEVGEDAGGEELFVFGEHAEQALDEEVGDALAAVLQPRPRMAAASWANWPAAWAVMAAVDFSGRSFSGSVNTQRRSWRTCGRPVARCGFRAARRGSR
jgi:hypothetical protein